MPEYPWTPEVVAFATYAVSALDPVPLTDAYRAFIRARGMAGFANGELDLRALSRTVMFAAEWPPNWMEFYARENLVRHDPIVSLLGRGRETLGWADIREQVRNDRPVRRAFEAAETFGWREGVFVRLPRGGSRWGLATVTGMEPGLTAELRAELEVAMTLFHERMRGLVAGEAPVYSASGLSARERECLALVARGLDDQAIGERLEIARSTAHSHIENAKRRLKTKSRTEAAAVAVSLGLIVV